MHCPVYETQDLQVLLDREKDRPAYVLASGPSLLRENPADMRGAVIVAVNRTILAEDELGTPPADYWVFADLPLLYWPKDPGQTVDVFDYPHARKWVSGSACPYMIGAGFHEARFEAGEEGNGNTVCFWRGHPSGIISRQLPNPLSWNTTVAPAIHIAWVLGCNPVHIRGLDSGVPDGDGRLRWYGRPGEAEAGAWEDAEHHLKHYRGQRRALSWLIHGMKTYGVTVTVRGDSDLADGPIPNDEPVKEG